MTHWPSIRSRSMVGNMSVGPLMHGSKGAPIWFLWVHLLLNGLMILPFGGLLERKEAPDKS